MKSKHNYEYSLSSNQRLALIKIWINSNELYIKNLPIEIIEIIGNYISDRGLRWKDVIEIIEWYPNIDIRIIESEDIYFTSDEEDNSLEFKDYSIFPHSVMEENFSKYLTIKQLIDFIMWLLINVKYSCKIFLTLFDNEFFPAHFYESQQDNFFNTFRIIEKFIRNGPICRLRPTHLLKEDLKPIRYNLCF